MVTIAGNEMVLIDRKTLRTLDGPIVTILGAKRTLDGPGRTSRAGTIRCPEISAIRCQKSLSC